jgi:aminoglycoside 6'-N-acetyltransferase
MRLRPATLDDLERLRHWDEQPHVVASDPNDDWGWERELAHDPAWREQLIAEVEGRPIGFIQIIDPAREDSHYWGDCSDNLRAIDLWIGEASDLGRGFGTQMMRLALARCFADPSVEAVIIDPLVSNTRAIRFYDRLGFRFVEQRRFGLDDCAVYRLERDAWRVEAARSLTTARLLLRRWRPDDRAPFAALNADARVAQFLPATLSRADSDALADRIEAGFARHGFGLWAVERREDPLRPFIGFIGLSVPSFSAPFTPCVEIGWRLAPEHWGIGLATEGARAVSRHAFEVLRLDEIVSFTVHDNTASRRVMEKIGMQRDPAEDFDHPRVAVGHPLRRHVLYRLRFSPRS